MRYKVDLESPFYPHYLYVIRPRRICMDPIKDSHKIFKGLAEKYGNKNISNRVQVADFFKDLLEATGGLIIVDFLDMENWDVIESFSFDEKSEILTLVWHDFRKLVETERRRELRQSLFPASLYSCALQINTILPVPAKESALFIINGYAKTSKEIKNLYRFGTDEIEIYDNGFFKKRVIRKVSGHYEVIDFHCTPLYSLVMMPKASGISSAHSKRFLYWKNVHVALIRIRKILDSFDEIDEFSHDEVSEKVNSVRRAMEYLLKVECCSKGLKISKEYSQVFLGDLIAIVKYTRESHIRDLLAKVAKFSNEFSHDTGKKTISTKENLPLYWLVYMQL
ncbi:sll1401 [Synechocystis sp. PCC 6803]|uniref:Sll1401 protein n=2 Tax=Synechocystis TaxID=1142 RepID=P72614_SYNY3|nr:hypothetical protein MYO_1360 [Synechocystis sp. PCC 6803]AVP88248.1 hypothetical protein C7I86_00180 [Synechocystis sp. IPPAS B-1465]MBD2619627.1 hypothetical protein [Synechocystis sp. FACHB-898]MBD2640357.1 hypothetical protein [Synechocystis sp. FACHB-908]MBD2662320.1 hypothetical protein [Synechocystis sp. FACHB-929]BAL27783.1 hypothetical protein SYNGTI_0036 [Synechocystis sp. PCC 6803 substr. GT-I]BAL30953.1 hypothetical protein SYNPCCN_0036 [Synechocystis sp. PCC 6803 substr. PCC-N